MDKHVPSTSFNAGAAIDCSRSDTAAQPEGSSVSLRLFSINGNKQFNGLVKILTSE